MPVDVPRTGEVRATRGRVAPPRPTRAARPRPPDPPARYVSRRPATRRPTRPHQADQPHRPTRPHQRNRARRPPWHEARRAAVRAPTVSTRCTGIERRSACDAARCRGPCGRRPTTPQGPAPRSTPRDRPPDRSPLVGATPPDLKPPDLKPPDLKPEFQQARHSHRRTTRPPPRRRVRAAVPEPRRGRATRSRVPRRHLRAGRRPVEPHRPTRARRAPTGPLPLRIGDGRAPSRDRRRHPDRDPRRAGCCRAPERCGRRGGRPRPADRSDHQRRGRAVLVRIRDGAAPSTSTRSMFPRSHSHPSPSGRCATPPTATAA